MELFGSGGGTMLAGRLSQTVNTAVPLLGQIPLDIALREGGDRGTPIVLADPASPGALALQAIADQLAVRPRGLSGLRLDVAPK